MICKCNKKCNNATPPTPEHRYDNLDTPTPDYRYDNLDTRILYYGANVFCDIQLSTSKQRLVRIYGVGSTAQYMRTKQ